ncbi:MAG: V-type ATPase subunit [Candidatus Omnitrophota bacterium]
MSGISPLNYTFAVAKIRALERFLIKQEVFIEAVESALDEALRLFAESGLYSDELLHVRDSRRLEEILTQESAGLKDLIGSLLLDKRLLGLLELNDLPCLKRALEHYRSDFLEDYLSQVIDMHNIKSFLRLYVLKEPLDELYKVIQCAGFIPKGDFIRLYSQDLAVFMHRLEYVHKRNETLDYASVLRGGINQAVEKKSFIALEKAMSSLLIGALKPAKYFTFGPEPVLAYYFARANEINLIRMTILAKLNNLDVGLLKERINAVYA